MFFFLIQKLCQSKTLLFFFTLVVFVDFEPFELCCCVVYYAVDRIWKETQMHSVCYLCIPVEGVPQTITGIFFQTGSGVNRKWCNTPCEGFIRELKKKWGEKRLEEMEDKKPGLGWTHESLWWSGDGTAEDRLKRIGGSVEQVDAHLFWKQQSQLCNQVKGHVSSAKSLLFLALAANISCSLSLTHWFIPCLINMGNFLF